MGTRLRKHRVLLLTVGVVVLLASCISVTADRFLSNQITSRVQQELPNASGVSASVPLMDLVHNLTSDSIKSVAIEIKNYALKESNTISSLAITASNVSKLQPTLVGVLDVTATIPLTTIIESSGFNDAKINGNALQVAVGPNGIAQALVIPKYSNGQLYFQLKSVSILGNQIPTSSLPSDIQNQIKSKSLRNLTVPKGLEVISVSIESDGLLLHFRGKNIQLNQLELAF